MQNNYKSKKYKMKIFKHKWDEVHWKTYFSSSISCSPFKSVLINISCHFEKGFAYKFLETSWSCGKELTKEFTFNIEFSTVLSSSNEIVNFNHWNVCCSILTITNKYDLTLNRGEVWERQLPVDLFVCLCQRVIFPIEWEVVHEEQRN